MPRNIIQPNKVALLTTNKCTASCKMCCFDCSPQNNEFVDPKVVEKVIYELKTSNSIKTIGFSGGEPFLLYDDLIKITKQVAALGVRVVCTSNGFWGNNYENAYKKLYAFQTAGLKKLSLSVDNFHQQYIPIENIYNIIRVCKKLCIPVDIGSVLTKGTDNLNNILEGIALELVDVPHYRAACLPVGAALKNISENEYIYDENIFEKDNKCFETSYFAIYLNGDVYPCCSQSGVIPVLKLGNIKKHSFDDLTKSYHRNMYCRIMKKYGFKWFYDASIQIGYNNLKEMKFVNKCHLCNYLLSNAHFIDAIAPLIEIEKERIYQEYIKQKNVATQ
ncbi:radical SAM/SPASM domain-containing protein [Butyrivibrio sp. MC2013]|uniref:radical SAM/SPASM domain-containing protein n=1 Tax=Butyrivibrio sp. MC2013 TaxID=1280686 RepID=UPI0003F6FF8A|nr:radical SAM protein [Butyrivibrio sp. MC2013]